jgi:mono/diheme cytochrome c family protein
MFPKPPQFFAHPASDHPAGEIYWAVKNGIRLSGMPAFSASMSDDQIWQVSLMLTQRDKLPDDMQKLLSDRAADPGQMANRSKQ